MRYVMAVVLLTACADTRATDEKIRALTELVADLQGQLDARRVPHLVVAATGEDLGISTGDSCAWSDAAKGIVCYGIFLPPYGDSYWSEPDCKGAALWPGYPRPGTFYVRGGSVVSLASSTKQPASYGPANCHATSSPGPFSEFVDGGVHVADHAFADVRVIVR